MSINFPNSPAINDTFIAGTTEYKWDGSKWVGLASNIKTINNISLLGSGNVIAGDVTLNDTQTLANKTIDYSTNTLVGVQPTLISGTTIKTINGASILGSGNIVVSVNENYVPIDSSTGAATLPVGTTAQRPAAPSVGMIRYNSTLKVNEVYTESQITPGTYSWRAIPTGDTIIQASTNGEATYTTPGTYSWVCPAGVTAVSVVCVGAGGGGAYRYSGGGGGGLAWCNNIPVTPGTSYTVVVGAGGSAGISTNTYGSTGGSSYFISTSIISAEGGIGGNYLANNVASGGGYNATSNYGTSGGGIGGPSGTSASTSYAGGGGGAGGYSGYGGTGGTGAATTTSGTAGTGGAGGGGGGAASTSFTPGGGGGTGIYGAGTSGLGGSGGTSSISGTRGGGGSAGVGGSVTPAGGQYGGGAGGNGGSGGDGAVRIIWGPNRAFPSTNTGIL